MQLINISLWGKRLIAVYLFQMDIQTKLIKYS